MQAADKETDNLTNMLNVEKFRINDDRKTQDWTFEIDPNNKIFSKYVFYMHPKHFHVHNLCLTA
jgi:hypothetical protein